MKKENKHTEITRKEAIKKMGKYAAFTAIGTFSILTPLKAQGPTSNPPDPAGRTDTSRNTTLEDDTTTPASSVQSSQVNKNQIQNNF